MKEIIYFNISTDDELALQNFWAEEQIQLKKILSLSDLETYYNLKDSDITFYIGVGDESDKHEMKRVIRKLSKRSLNLIFKSQRFDILLTAYRYQVHYVFENHLSEAELKNSQDKAHIIALEESESIPLEKVLKLFSISLKVKSAKGLYDRIKSYLENFEDVKKFGIIEVKDDGFENYGDEFSAIYEKYIEKMNLPKHYIGFEKSFDKGENNIIITPTFVGQNDQSWLIIEIRPDKKEYILNALFYKYLENILIYRKNKEKEEDLRLLASTDEITGLYNQRQLSEDLEREISKHEKEHENFSIMFIDVDHFKMVNDNYGHVVGSKLLLDMGNALKQILRQSDHIYRYGGDEFVIIMPNIKNKTVHEIALRVLKKIKDIDFQIDNGDIYKMSISIGIAEYPTDAKSAVEIIKFADEMMYMSKKSGRGKVFHVNEVSHVDASSE